jgi:hypothetical protein
MMLVLHDQVRGVGTDESGPLGHVSTHMHAQVHAYRGSRRGRADRHDSRSTQRQQLLHVNRCGNSVPAGGQELHACAVGLPRQSGRRRRGACIPFVGCAHASREVCCLRCFPATCKA